MFWIFKPVSNTDNQSSRLAFSCCLPSSPLEAMLTIANPWQSQKKRVYLYLFLPGARPAAVWVTHSQHIPSSPLLTAQITTETRRLLTIDLTLILTQNELKPCASTTLLWDRAVFSAAADTDVAPLRDPVLHICSMLTSSHPLCPVPLLFLLLFWSCDSWLSVLVTLLFCFFVCCVLPFRTVIVFFFNWWSVGPSLGPIGDPMSTQTPFTGSKMCISYATTTKK